MKAALLAAARADDIPAGVSGLWTVKKFQIAKPLRFIRTVNGHRRMMELERGRYTQLWRATLACQKDHPMKSEFGDLVMHDTPEELRTHLEFMLKAQGRVLITGLGLGCVARGCLANPAVESVTIIERDPSVMKLVAPWMPKERLNIIVADAVTWAKQNTERFDCAWHDLWSDPDKEEQNLQITHMELIFALAESTGFQGAWQFPRKFRLRTCNII